MPVAKALPTHPPLSVSSSSYFDSISTPTTSIELSLLLGAKVPNTKLAFFKSTTTTTIPLRSSPSSSSRKRTRSLVRFAKYDQVMEIPHLDDMSDEEIQDVWISPKEFRDLRRQARRVVALMEENKSEHQQQEGRRLLCTRGLDYHTEHRSKQLEALQSLIYEAVARIQSFQFLSENTTHIDHVQTLMGQLCQKYSAASVASALEVAQRDAIEAAIM